MDIFRKRLRELRFERDLKQTDIAKVMNVVFGTISNWERGLSSPNIEELKRLADFFDVSADYLLGRTDNY
ncbi:MAG: helix-turn-helix domain-containing protein [Firmicutes bacterium]|nr:helix-turn-helix domain-containing protein [Bacillota bacterium]